MVLLYVFVDAAVVGLVEHPEFDVARLRRDDEVERVAEDGRVGDRVDGCEVEEGEGLLEAP